MSVLAVVAAVAAAVLLVASVRAFLIGGLRHRLPSMPDPNAEHDLRERSTPRWIWIMGGCLVGLPAVALPFRVALVVAIALAAPVVAVGATGVGGVVQAVVVKVWPEPSRSPSRLEACTRKE